MVALLQRSLRHAQLLNASRTDAKTGLLNARTWESEAEAEVARAVRARMALAVAVLDIDFFKLVNDTYGHLFGDEVLKEIAHCLPGVLREYDSAGRFGGEEFVLLLPHTRAVDAFRIADRVRDHISGLSLLTQDGQHVEVTVSVGVAALDAGSSRELSELLAAADAALYRAKRDGRNQVQMISTTRGLSASRRPRRDQRQRLRGSVGRAQRVGRGAAPGPAAHQRRRRGDGRCPTPPLSLAAGARARLRGRSAPSCSTPVACCCSPPRNCCCLRCTPPGWSPPWPSSNGLTTGPWPTATGRAGNHRAASGGGSTCATSPPPAACPPPTVDAVASDIVGLTDGFAWTHVGPGVAGALREIAALGLPVGIVSNSTGQVEQALRPPRRLLRPQRGRARQRRRRRAGGAQGINVGVVIDSAVVGVSKPDPQIFALALAALGLSDVDRSTVVHVGDSLRYDVAGALAAGVRPLHLDPHGFCPAPDGHEHIRRLSDVAALATP